MFESTQVGDAGETTIIIRLRRAVTVDAGYSLRARAAPGRLTRRDRGPGVTVIRPALVRGPSHESRRSLESRSLSHRDESPSRGCARIGHPGDSVRLGGLGPGVGPGGSTAAVQLEYLRQARAAGHLSRRVRPSRPGRRVRAAHDVRLGIAG